MKTVEEIKAAIRSLSPEERAELDYWQQDNPAHLDPEVDSPQLEAELLKAVRGPHEPFSIEELRSVCEKILREKRGRANKSDS